MYVLGVFNSCDSCCYSNCNKSEKKRLREHDSLLEKLDARSLFLEIGHATAATVPQDLYAMVA